MTGCCKSKSNITKKTTSTKQSLFLNNLKTSIFCGTKGFLTFNLACLSYLEYSIYEYISHNRQEEDSNNNYSLLKYDAIFAMKRNTIPFLEMISIVPFVCFWLPNIINGPSTAKCAFICAALMIITCLLVRKYHWREGLLEKWTNFDREDINKKFTTDSIIYPIFDEKNKRIRYDPLDKEHILQKTSCLASFAICFLKVPQSFILLFLANVEFLEAIPSLLVDLFYDRSFESTKSNFQKATHLLYASVRNLIPMSKLDAPVAEFIGTPKVACCGI